MRWLAVTGDLAFNLLFAVLAFASLEQAAWTPFATPDHAQELRVLVRPAGALVGDEHGSYRALEAGDLKDKVVVLHVSHEYPGVVADLVALKERLARGGARAYREEVAR